jgi:hypothetical protein
MHPTSPLLRPDTLLYIYYIEGIVPAHHTIEAEGFIGNWVEEDFSFLFSPGLQKIRFWGF